MKLIFECIHCSEEQRKLVMQSTQPIKVSIDSIIESQILVSITENNIYHFRCKKGHDNISYLNNPKFEILYESGINAMLDGYFAESVLTMTAALERAREFFIEIISYKNNMEIQLYKTVFKLIADHSERQIGAFFFLYANTLQKKPPVVDDKKISFRNKVIHKGMIPNAEETEGYAIYIYDAIKQIFCDALEFVGREIFNKYLDAKYQDSVIKLTELHKKYPTYQSFMSMPTMLCHMFADIESYRKIDYQSALNNSKYWKEKRSNPLASRKY
jgi:hypothetical protein